MIKKVLLALVALFLLLSGYYFVVQEKAYKSLQSTRFFKDTSLEPSSSAFELTKDSDGTVKYYHDNFSSYYDTNSSSIENFESTENISSINASNLRLSDDRYEGQHSLEADIQSNSDNQIKFIKNFNNDLKNLEKWNESGNISLWLNVQDRKGIDNIRVRFVDSQKRLRTYKAVINVQTDMPNTKDSDDIMPDISLSSGEKEQQWTDYYINKGWNFVFWKCNKEEYSQDSDFDIKNIASVEVEFDTDKNLKKQSILIDDLRIQDGLQKTNNALNGVWYPPNELPQYGIYDVTRDQNGQDYLKLLNVRQTQYPSNGDHGRMVSSFGTPINFSMRAKFKLTNLSDDKTNTWFRATYDFEPDYDPGHDWFGSFMTLEFKKLGLINVKPIERNLSQEQEPLNQNISDSSVGFSPKNDCTYELQMTVIGQSNKVSVYEVKNNKYRLIKNISYDFKRKREIEKRYPFALEITGNTKAEISEIEIQKL